MVYKFMPKLDVDNTVQIRYNIHIVGLSIEMLNLSGRLGSQFTTYSTSHAMGQSGQTMLVTFKASIMQSLCFDVI